MADRVGQRRPDGLIADCHQRQPYRAEPCYPEYPHLHRDPIGEILQPLVRQYPGDRRRNDERQQYKPDVLSVEHNRNIYCRRPENFSNADLARPALSREKRKPEQAPSPD